jgi:homoprotocatechuate degradation regulator HpaR
MRDFSRSLPMALLRAREAVMGRFRPTLRDYDLTEQQWRVLRALSWSPAPLRPTELARLTLLSMPSLSRLLKTLEARRLIRRSTHKDDLRSAQLSMTGSGHALVAAIAPLSEANYARIAELIGEKDLEQLYSLLGSIADRLGVSTDQSDE